MKEPCDYVLQTLVGCVIVAAGFRIFGIIAWPWWTVVVLVPLGFVIICILAFSASLCLMYWIETRKMRKSKEVKK